MKFVVGRHYQRLNARPANDDFKVNFECVCVKGEEAWLWSEKYSKVVFFDDRAIYKEVPPFIS